MLTKYYITYNHIHQLISKQVAAIKASGFKPDYLIAIGGGGYIPARILRSFLNVPIVPVTIEVYGDGVAPNKPVVTQWYDDQQIDLQGKRLLIVDDVDDSRTTLSFCCQRLLQVKPDALGIFVIHQKRKAKAVTLPPQVQHLFAGEQTDDIWICYPWDAEKIYEHDEYCSERIEAMSLI